MGKTVEGADTITNTGEQTAFFAQKTTDTGAEIFDRAIGKGNNQDFTISQVALARHPLHQVCGEQTQCKGLAAAWYSTDAHIAACIGQNAFLGGAGNKG